MAARTRRRITSSRAPLRSEAIGGESRADIDLGRDATRASRELSIAKSRQDLSKMSDPFAKMVNELDSQVKYLKSREAFQKLASDDPKGFLRDAREKLAGMDIDDPQRSLWLSAIQKAEDKLEDQQWSNDLKLGVKEYEDWKKHLEAKLTGARPGSPDASELIQAVASANKSIKARDEAKLDQTALLKYTNSDSPDRHDKYKEYLQSKLSRVKDGGVQTELLKQIETLGTRKQKEESIERAQRKSAILTDYLQNGNPVEAMSKLQALAREKGISKEEVDALQKSVENVVKREEDKIEDAARKAKSGAAGSSKAAGAAVDAYVDAAEREYEKVNSQIQTALAKGETVPRELVERLEAAGSVLEATYTKAGNDHPNQQAGSKLLMAAINVEEKVAAVQTKVDKITLSGADLSTEGKSAFAAAMSAAAAGKDGAAFGAAADVAHARLIALSRAEGKLFTKGAEGARLSELHRVASLERAQIGALSRYAPKDEASKTVLDEKYSIYKADESIPDGDKVTQTEFERALRNSTTADEFAKKIQLGDNRHTVEEGRTRDLPFGQTHNYKEKVQAQKITDDTFLSMREAAFYVGGRQSSADAGGVVDRWTRLVRTPGVITSPEERYMYDQYGNGGLLDESTRAARTALISSPKMSMELDDYMDDVFQTKPSKGPAGAMARPKVPGYDDSESGLMTPEAVAAEAAIEHRGLVGSTPQALEQEQPTINEGAPEQTPNDFQITEGEPWETRDPVEEAFRYLNSPEDFDIQGMSIPRLPDDDVMSSTITEDEYSSPFRDRDKPKDEEADPWTSRLPDVSEDARDKRLFEPSSGGQGTEGIAE